MSRQIYLSKSKLISGWQCEKRLWLEKHKPELVEISPSTQAAFAVGHSVGDMAQALFPGGTLIKHDHELSLALKETQSLLAQPGPVTLYEGTFQADGVLIRADILERSSRDGVRLVEVKAATKVKDYYLYDCAIQLWVMERLGINVQKLELAHINNQFVYKGDKEYQGLLTYVDVLEEARSLQSEVGALIDEMRAALVDDEPDIEMGGHCTSPFECPFYSYCEGPQPEMPVSWLPGGRRAANGLRDAGYRDIREIPEDYLDNEVAERCRRVAITGEPFLDSRAAEELGQLGWPRYYFDFETLAPAVPVFADTSPYKAQAFQWSCHIEHQNGELEHEEFLADGKEPPMRACAESLIEVLGNSGPVFMYSNYERTVIRGLARLFPDLCVPLNALVDRLFDLYPVTKDYFYHPDMRGSWSIKSVLPAITTGLDYRDLTIVSSGMMAEPIFLEMIDKGTTDARKSELRIALLAYCERDTLAMVKLAHYLEGREPRVKN